jgi:hypothetical protein
MIARFIPSLSSAPMKWLALLALVSLPLGSACGTNEPPPLGGTPQQWADSWVDGWLASTARGVDRYELLGNAGYPDGYYVQWADDPGVTQYASVTDCSGFSNVLLERSYGWLPPTSHSRPLAEDYYWAIRGGDHFSELTNIADLVPGDTIALLYGKLDDPTDTGHVAWIDAAPVPYDGMPVEAGLSQFAVTVVDSDDGFHAAPGTDTTNQDDRYLGAGSCDSDSDCTAQYGPNAVCDTWQLAVNVCAYTGIGRGRLRIYADAGGAIAGYTWATEDTSVFYTKLVPAPTTAEFSGRDIVVGRYTE